MFTTVVPRDIIVHNNFTVCTKKIIRNTEYFESHDNVVNNFRGFVLKLYCENNMNAKSYS